MRSKAPLALIEQAVMLLVFALAAVLCLKAFVWADARSEHSAAQDHAVLAAQNAAETLKHCRGDFAAAAALSGGIWDGQQWVILYDEQWNVTDDMHEYTLRVLPCESGVEYLGSAGVEVFREEMRLAYLDVCWQEVSVRE